ncbi:MAG: hypothetical protein WKF36_07900 [Candidatus Nitrosocosmicus sp.]
MTSPYTCSSSWIYPNAKKYTVAIVLWIMVNRETRVVNCKKEPYDVYIGRPSKWGKSIQNWDRWF